MWKSVATALAFLVIALFYPPVSAEGEAVADTVWTDSDSRLANHYLRLLQNKPEYGNILDLLWDLYAKKDQTPLLLDYLKKAAAGETATVPRLIYAHLLRKAERIDEAREIYDDVAKADPSNIPALKALAEIAEQQERRAKALSYYTRLVGLIPADSDTGVAIRIRKAELHQSLGQNGQALPLWNELLLARPGDAALRGEIVAHLLEAGETGVAIRVLEEQAQTSDAAARLDALSELERVYLLINDFEGASRASREAMAILHFKNHRHRDFFERLVRLHERFDRLEELERLLSGSVEEQNPSERSLFLLASFYEMTANSSREESVLLRLVERLPDNVDYRVRLAELQLANDRFEDAASTLDSIIAEQETVPLHLMLLRVRVDISAEEELAAEERLSGYLKANPEDPELRETIIDFARSHYMDDLVEKLLRESAAGELTGSDGDSAPFALARFLHERGRREQARGVIEKFVEGAGRSSTERTRRFHQAALAYQDLGMLESAEAAIDEALAAGPDNIEFLSTKAGLLVDRGRIDEAVRTLETIWGLESGLKPRSDVDQKIFSLLRAGIDSGDGGGLEAPIPSGPIKSAAQYRKVAAMMSRSRETFDKPPQKLTDYFEEIRKRANREPSVENRYRAGWWAFKLQNNSECYFQLSAAQKEAEEPVAAVEELLLELAEQNERPTLMARHLKTLSEVDPVNRDDYLQRWAEVRFQLGFEDEAVRALKKLAANPEASLNTHAALAKLYAQQGSPGKQVAVWEAAYRKANLFEKRRIVRQLVTALVDQGKPQAALKALMDLVERESDVLQRRKQFESQMMVASRHYLLDWLKDRYLEAVQKQPFDRFFPEALGRIHLALGNHREAFEFMKKAYYMSEENEDLLFELGELSSKLGDLKSAIYYSRQTIARGEGASDIENWEKLITMLERDFRSGEADLMRKRLEIKFGQHPEFLARLADFYRTNDRPLDAGRVLKRRANLLKWDVKARFDLAHNLLAMGNSEEAFPLFVSVIEATRDEPLPEWARDSLWPLIESGAGSRSRLEQWNAELQSFPYLPIKVKDDLERWLEEDRRPEFADRPSEVYAIRLRAIESAALCVERSGVNRNWVRDFLALEVPRHEKWWAAFYSRSGEELSLLFRESPPADSPGILSAALGLLRSGAIPVAREWCEGSSYLSATEKLTPLAASVLSGYSLLRSGGENVPVIPFLAELEIPAGVSDHVFTRLRDAGRWKSAVRLGAAIMERSPAGGGGEFYYSLGQVAGWMGDFRRKSEWLDRLLTSIRLETGGEIPALVQLAIAERYRLLESADEKREFLRDVELQLSRHPVATGITGVQTGILAGALTGNREAIISFLGQLTDRVVETGPEPPNPFTRRPPPVSGWERMQGEFRFYTNLFPRSPRRPWAFAEAMGGEPLSLDVDEFSLRDYEDFEIHRIVELLNGRTAIERGQIVDLALTKFHGMDGRLDLARRLQAFGYAGDAALVYHREVMNGSEDFAALRGLFQACDSALLPGLALETIEKVRTREIASPPGLAEDYLNGQHARFLFLSRDLETLTQLGRPPVARAGNPPIETEAHLPYQEELIRALHHTGDHEALLRVLAGQKQREESETAHLVLAAELLIERGQLEEALRWLDAIQFNRTDVEAEKEAIGAYLRIFSLQQESTKAQLLWLARLALHYGAADLTTGIAGLLLDRNEVGEAVSVVRIQRRNVAGASARADLQFWILEALAEKRPGDAEAISRELETFFAGLENPVPDGLAFVSWCERNREWLRDHRATFEQLKTLPGAGGLARLILGRLTGNLEEEVAFLAEELDADQFEGLLYVLPLLGDEGGRLAEEIVAASGKRGPEFFVNHPERQLRFFSAIGDRNRLLESHAVLMMIGDSYFFPEVRRKNPYPSLLNLAAVPAGMAELGETGLAGALFRNYYSRIRNLREEFVPFVESYLDFLIGTGDFEEADRIFSEVLRRSLGFDLRKLVTLYEKWGRIDELDVAAARMGLTGGERIFIHEWQIALKEGREMVEFTNTNP